MKINSRTGCYQYWAFRAALGYGRGRGKRSRKNDFEQGRKIDIKMMDII